MFENHAVGLPPAERSAPLTWLAPVSLALLVAAALPVVLWDVPPLGDYPNHLMRMYAIAYLDLDPDLARFYRIEWGLLPNLVMDLVVPPLGRMIGVEEAFRTFVVAAFLLMVSGTFALYRAVWGRLDLGPLTAFLFLYTLVTYMGLFNYLFGVGLALWSVAAWIWASERGPLARTVVSLIVVPLLYFAHLFALGLYGLSLLAYEGWRLTVGGVWTDRRALIADLAAFALPFLVAIGLLMKSPTSSYADASLWVGSAKLMGFDWLFGAYSTPVGFVTGGAVLLGMGWGLWSGALRVHPVGWMLGGLGLLVYAAMPLVLFGSYFADCRLPVAVALLVIGFSRWDLPTQAGRATFVAAVAALALLRVADAGAAFARVEPAVNDMRQALMLVPPGSTLLVAITDGSERRSLFRPTQYTDDRAVAFGLHHMPVLAMQGSSFVSTAFTHHGKQVLQTRDEYSDLDSSITASLPRTSELAIAARAPTSGLYWGHWTERFDYVMVLYTDPSTPNPVPDRLFMAHEGQHFRLYRVVKR